MSASAVPAPQIQRYLDPVIDEFTTGEYYREVYAAKQEFFEKAGIVYEDDPEYEQRMSIFMDWYIFERDLPGVDLRVRIGRAGRAQLRDRARQAARAAR